jgi:hypothetical protein
VSASLCDSIAQLRKRIQRIHKNNVVFLDESAMRLSEAPGSTLVAPGEKHWVVVEDSSSYAARYDLIGCCVGDQALPPMIYTPTERKDINVKGINSKMVVQYIQHILAQALGALDRYPMHLVLDRSSAHHKAKMLEAFYDNGCQSMVHIWFMPPKAAKRMSPLDNALFHEWKERVRKRAPIKESNIEQVMSDEWNNLPAEHIRNYYQHCGLTGYHNPYFDCPNPSPHNHDTSSTDM